MIKIEHSIFALPFALASAFLAAKGLPDLRILTLIILAMVFARSAAMAFNRYLDADIDAKNPRTATRSIPAGRLSRRYSLFFTIACSFCFAFVAYSLNMLAFYLSPVALIVLLGYSYTKRFTSYCHFVLGLALGIAPIGAWVAIRGEIAPIAVMLGAAVMFWTAGFDLIYACQDTEFDKENALHSVPAKIGIHKALLLSRILHCVMISLLVIFGFETAMGLPYWVGLSLVVLTLLYEHSLVWNANLERVTMAFFTMNGVVSIVFGIAVIWNVLLI